MATTLEPAPAPEAPESLHVDRLPRWATVGAAVVSGAVAAILNLTTGLAGVGGTTVVWVLLFVVGLAVWSFAVEGRRHAVDRLATILVYGAAIAALAPLVAILVAVLIRGLKVFDVYFLTHSMRNVSALTPGGGVYHAIIGTLEMVGIAAAIGIPIGLLAAIYLVEYGGRGKLARAITLFVDVMTGVPSIVAGLFVYTGLILGLGFSRSGFAAALSLTILMIPVMVRSGEEMLKLVPNELREASYALGIPKYRTILRIVLPTALPGLVTGAMLAVARIIGETAPLLLTVNISTSIEWSPFASNQASIPTFVWDQIQRGTDASIDRAWAGALTLILIVFILNVTARLIARRFHAK